MPTMNFDLGGTVFENVPITAHTRAKLYGRTEIAATDGGGAPCRKALLDPDGSLILPGKGGKGTGYLAGDGTWVSELKAVDADGNELPVVPSSLGTTVALSDETDEDGFLDHAWKAVYQLDDPDLAAALGGRIFRFPFNYRADASPEEACLLASGGFAWLFSGAPVAREFVGLDQGGELEEAPEDEEPAEEEELDFGVL